MTNEEIKTLADGYYAGNADWLNKEQEQDTKVGWRQGFAYALRQFAVSGSLRFSEREVDFAYLCGVFNASGIDGLYTEIQRLKELGKEPHDIIEACRKQ